MITPEGFATVTPYLFVDGAEDYSRFIIDGLDGEPTVKSLRDDGKIANAQFRIGNSTIMISEAGRGFPATSASYYLYVDNADGAVARAVAAGGVSIMEIADMPYGDRQGGVRDSQSNIWWISQRLTDEPYTD